MNKSKKTINKRRIAEFFKFQVVGVANFLVDYGVLYLLATVLGMMTAPANIISYSCGVINSFVLNRFWTFKQKLPFFSMHFVKFLFVNLVALGVNTLTVWVLIELYGFTDGLFGMENMYAKLIATVASFTVNFAGNKLLVFTETNDDKASTHTKTTQDNQE